MYTTIIGVCFLLNIKKVPKKFNQKHKNYKTINISLPNIGIIE